MAYITLNPEKLRQNYRYLDKLFTSNGIGWAIVTKMLCGSKEYLREVLSLGIRQICDSRLSNLKAVKAIDPDIETIYIKPPAKRFAARIIEYADISFNTDYQTIRLLSDAAVVRNKQHKIVIMIELGELREGVMREQFMDFYEKVFELPNIEVIGIGTNLSCMYGVLPSHDKLIQLCLYKQLVEARFNKKIPYVSGGTSVTIPLIKQKLLPKGINHFRVGETLFLGTDVYNDQPNKSLHQDVFKLYAEIIELNEKPMVPDGQIGTNLTGETVSIEDTNSADTSFRAIVDIGLLDVEDSHICPVNDTMKIVGASSDMTVIDIGNNDAHLKTGDLIEFKLDYMAILRIMNSNYIEKRLESGSKGPARIKKPRKSFLKMLSLN